ncbi:MAG: hypothetical protein JOZ33_09145 [Acidobacteriaceae bacterium]|nr:hypothetical protein [Acidobacteriaceae bacterium]
MARGWESKSVEEQVSQGRPANQSAPDPKQQAAAARAEAQRRRQGLELQRERILDERTSNPHRRAALEAALAQVEEQLSKIQ